MVRNSLKPTNWNENEIKFVELTRELKTICETYRAFCHLEELL